MRLLRPLYCLFVIRIFPYIIVLLLFYFFYIITNKMEIVISLKENFESSLLYILVCLSMQCLIINYSHDFFFCNLTYLAVYIYFKYSKMKHEKGNQINRVRKGWSPLQSIRGMKVSWKARAFHQHRIFLCLSYDRVKTFLRKVLYFSFLIYFFIYFIHS